MDVQPLRGAGCRAEAGQGPPQNKVDSLGRRDARPARRESERAYRAYVSDEPRRQAGCIDGQDVHLILRRALTRLGERSKDGARIAEVFEDDVGSGRA